MYQIPVLFIIFRRKEVALRAFERIRDVRPAKLYIACDGPRDDVENEAELVKETREAILNAIDWDCSVHKLFQEKNLGCGIGVYTAINWLFENEEMGIILEDDCMMQHSFFPFAEELLFRYKDDLRVGMIDGANYITHVEIPDSYGFSQYKSTNGWATWQRAWKLMDMNMNWRNTQYGSSVIANMGYRSRDIKYWKYRLKVVDYNDVSAWDWQWYFTLAAYNMLGIYPKYNLTTNIGFGAGATHTSDAKTPSNYIATKELEFPLKHPQYVLPFSPFDKGFYNWNNNLYTNLMKYLPIRIKIYLKRKFKL